MPGTLGAKLVVFISQDKQLCEAEPPKNGNSTKT
jgi:hypothetical protein